MEQTSRPISSSGSSPARALPVSPDLDHLKKQAKDLLRLAHEGDAAALARFVALLPAVHGATLAELATHRLLLHDAQSVVAREYGFRSWTELKRYVEWQQADRAGRFTTWVQWVYDGNVRERRLALRMLREEPALFVGDPWLACALGDVASIEAAVARDAGFVRRVGGLRGMPPLVAVTHSKLMLEPGFEAGFLASARFLLEYGADPNSRWTNPQYPESPLSALYGAAGLTHSAAMTQLLLEAGASPDDNESLYHSMEGSDPECLRLLIASGVRVAGTNSVARCLDYDKLDALKLLLVHGQRQNGDDRGWLEGALHHAILRGRSAEHVRVLMEAGADVRFVDRHGISVYRCAQFHGRDDVVALLARAGVEEPLSLEEEFVAAATRGDEAAAREILGRVPGLVSRLNPVQLLALPNLAATRGYEGVRCMLALGWPLEVKTGWNATALNWAVFKGDARMAEILLQGGADWRSLHGFKDNVVGTLSWASQSDEMEGVAGTDYVGCARVLVAYGVPLSAFDDRSFSSEVAEYLDSCRLRAS